MTESIEMTCREAAETLHMKVRTVQRLAQPYGPLAGRKSGGIILIPASTVKAYAAKRAAEAVA